ncbi:uncharacterized protein LY89DRAFT_693830 [Mollisia scopiformis]|uniref:Zn(2)-C6 fungal-type domain-containing protein n=1 Tax=Mollisia scopiformis TaxID=149040 RepID=A0A194XQB3_MOLSC|nr:uncharacterized protein LY89DRAFT_693830 [Mollisia scopiformis]KUJ22450.1 hypothetical protein LY89DRAFT_693830 [Mollisia scopiformis]
MRLCGICHKPFLKETSYNRHISYCRRTQTRPRTRVRSCRACSLAKTKCNFHSPCLRCTKRDLDCVYDTKVSASTSTAQVDGEDQAQIDTSDFPPTSLPGCDFNLNHMFTPGGAIDTDESQLRVDMDWNTLGLTAADLELPKDSLPELPWSTWTHRDEYALILSGHSDPSERPYSEYLSPVPTSDPVLQFTANMLIQMLRAFPQMMLRRETLPAFIHGHWYRPSGTTGLALPEPLVNCMGLAQVFAAHNPESKPFLWRTVKTEQRSFIEKQDKRQFSRDGLLAAVQAQIIYIIMKVTDNSKFEQDLNLEMIITFQALCESFRELCNEPFCQDERMYPSFSWEDWVFAESRRRTVLVWFLIAQTVRIKIGVPCDAFEDFRNLPLCSSKSLWEARTRLAWQSEYEVYKNMQRTELESFGDLIDAYKERDVGANQLRLDAWIARADNLGVLLSLGAVIASRKEG